MLSKSLISISSSSIESSSNSNLINLNNSQSNDLFELNLISRTITYKSNTTAFFTRPLFI